VPRVGLQGRRTILALPEDLELLLERVEPEYLGYDATFHSLLCYTIVVLSIDYRYTAWRAHLSLDGRWSLSPLDYAATFQLVANDER
jgi:hypothetical protein